MGAWGTGSFENDAALDWVAELQAAGGPDVLDRTLRRATEDPALSEVRGLWEEAPPEHRDEWLRRVADVERRLSSHER